MINNDWLDIEVLEDYLDGKLDAKEMHRVERISLEDPFVAQALAGLSESKKRTQTLSLLQKQLQERIAQKPVERKMWGITSQRLSIGAAAAVLFVTVSVLFWMKESNRRELAKNQPKNVVVNVAPQVAVTAPTTPVPPAATAITEKEIDKALANAKSTQLAKNNTVKAVTASSVPATADDIADKLYREAKPVVNRSKVDTTTEVITLKTPIAAKAKAATQTLSSKAEGVTFVPTVFSGKIISKVDGLPIQGVSVKLANSDKITVTNNRGEFALTADSAIANPKLSIASIGYVSKEVKADQKLNIELEQQNSSLNEVVVLTSSTPVNGKEAFGLYLKNNNKLDKGAGKSVVLRFDIRSNGTPYNVKVVSGLSKAENDEAIRLLLNGPKWTTPNRSGNKATATINF